MTTFADAFDNFSRVTDLNFVEKLWASYYYWINNDLFATGLFSS